MINPNNFINRNLKIGFKISLDSHIISIANSILTFLPIYTDFATDQDKLIKL